MVDPPFDISLGNIFSALQIPDAYAIGKGGLALAKKVTSFNQVRKATADIVSSAAKNPDATAATMAEGAGDVRTAVVEKMAANIEAALNGNANPLKAARDAFLSTWKEDGEKFKDNQGTFLSRELLTRIQDGFAKDGEALLDKIMTMNRVERTPIAVTSKDVINAYIEQIKNEYKGPANTLADVEGPIREPISGTYWYKQKLVNYDGTQFADVDTAKGFANQIGLANPIIKGTAPEYVYLPEAAAKNIESIKTTTAGTKFYMDHGVEIVASPEPQPGSVAFNLKTQKFETGKAGGGSPSRFNGYTKDQVKSILDRDRAALKEAKEPSDIAILNKNIKEYEEGLSSFDKPFEGMEAPSSAIQQQGLGFHIEVWTPMKENSDLIRDTMIRTVDGKSLIADAISNTTSASGTKRIINSVLGWVRNSDETLSTNETAQRKAVTYTQANIQLWAQDLYKDLEDIAAGRVRQDPITGEDISPFIVHPKTWFGKISNREVAQQFERTLDYARKAKDEKGRPGYFFKTAGDLQDHYQRNFKRDPSYLETRAYFNYTKLVEGDRMLGEIAEFRNRARVGTEQHQIKSFDKNGNEVKSKFFDGIKLNEFPRAGGDILIAGRNYGSETLYELGKINTKKLHELTENVKTGKAKVIQLYDRDHQPLSDYSDVTKDKLIQYVYTENAETKPLEFNHVERRGGGHFGWDYDRYLKQADVRKQQVGGRDKRSGLKYVYVGDKTVMPIKNRKLGEDVAKIWNEAQEYIKKDEWDKAKPLAAKLGIKWEDFTSWYKSGRLDPNEPIIVVQKNKKISEMGSDLANRYRFKKPDGSYRDL